MSADVTVVIVSYNSASVIEDLLDSLAGALGAHTAEIVVVDNGSSDDTVAIVEGNGSARIIRSQNLGYSAGINRGVNSTENSPYILVLNPDVILQHGSIPAMLQPFEEERVGIIAPRITDAEGGLTKSIRREPSLKRALGLGFTGLAAVSEPVTDEKSYQYRHEIDWATGAVLLIRRTCFDDLHGWDESFFLYSEETDFCLRARDSGWKTVFEPSAIAIHIEGASGRSGRTQAMQTLNQVRLYHRRHGKLMTWLFYFATVLGELSRVVRRRPNSSAALKALVWPRSRPVEMGLTNHLLPSDHSR